MKGFRIEAPKGRRPVLAPLSPAATGAAADIAARSLAVDAGFGGGEIVIRETDSATLDALARALDDHEGSILAMPGPDVPFGVFLALADRTPYVVGRESGDPSAFTALGAFAAIRAGRPDLAGARIGILGAGRVGRRLAVYLAAAGARLVLADLRGKRARSVAEEVCGEVVDPGALAGEDLDVFSPNARGRALATEDVARLRCRLVAGAANGPFGPGAREALDARRIAWVPEEIAGSGWLLALAAELPPRGYDRGRAERMVMGIEEKARCWLSKKSG